MLRPSVPWKENQKTGNFTQSEQWAGEPGCCVGSKKVPGQGLGIRGGFLQERT